MHDEEIPADDIEVTPTGAVEEPPVEAGEDEGFLGTPWSRRTFLKAAALGTAAAAVFQKGPGWSFGPAAAYADDLSGLNCTANDVRIVGPGIILNEPCTCAAGGTFTAQVQFHVINNTGTDRYCVTTHFCAGKNAAGQVVIPAQDVVFGDIAANFDGNVTVEIPNYPCGSGLVCFGAAGSQADGGFAKGEDCPSGQCCTTITWNVKASDPCPDTTRQISSKCRHQQVCIQGFGITAQCANGSCAPRSLTNNCCSVDCGASLYVKITVTGQSGTPCANPPTVSVKRPGETGFTNVSLNSSGCYVDSSPVAGTYTFKATDCHNCSRETTLAVCVTQPTIGAPTLVDDPCSGKAKFRAGTVTGGTAPFTYQFKLDSGSFVNGSGTNGDEYVYSPTAGSNGLDTSCHSLVVKVTDTNGCTATSNATTFSQCIDTSTGCTVS